MTRSDCGWCGELGGQGRGVKVGEGGVAGEEVEPVELNYGVVHGESGDEGGEGSDEGGEGGNGGMREWMTQDGEWVVGTDGGVGGRPTVGTVRRWWQRLAGEERSGDGAGGEKGRYFF